MGIIPYVLTGDERHLDLRGFPDDIKLAVWEKQHHICPSCQKEFDYEFIREFGIRKGLKKLVISSKIRIFIGENQ